MTWKEEKWRWQKCFGRDSFGRLEVLKEPSNLSRMGEGVKADWRHGNVARRFSSTFFLLLDGQLTAVSIILNSSYLWKIRWRLLVAPEWSSCCDLRIRSALSCWGSAWNVTFPTYGCPMVKRSSEDFKRSLLWNWYGIFLTTSCLIGLLLVSLRK